MLRATSFAARPTALFSRTGGTQNALVPLAQSRRASLAGPVLSPHSPLQTGHSCRLSLPRASTSPLNDLMELDLPIQTELLLERKPEFRVDLWQNFTTRKQTLATEYVEEIAILKEIIDAEAIKKGLFPPIVGPADQVRVSGPHEPRPLDVLRAVLRCDGDVWTVEDIDTGKKLTYFVSELKEVARQRQRDIGA